MAASKDDIGFWFDRGIAMGASHMAVFCDTFDYDDYPVYVMPEDDARSLISKHQDRLMEVYNLSLDKASQMLEQRAFHYCFFCPLRLTDNGTALRWQNNAGSNSAEGSEDVV